MKRTLFTTVSLGVLGLMSPALGADLPPYGKAPAVVSPLYDWSGFYVGVFGGGGFGNHNVNNGTPNGFASYIFTYDATGAVAGGEIGYNFQSGSYVVGVEATGFWSDIKGDDASQQLGLIDADNLRDVVTLVGRGGITVDRLMLFFTGGWAYGDILHTNTNPGNIPAVDQFSTTRSGLTAGGGIAYAITDNLIGKFEYRYFDFGSYSRPGLAGGVTVNGLAPYTVNTTYSVVTLGLDYKFGGPVVAKY
ncbi:outer membrane protein [Bradyrhizobium sp.]|jgi:outer membrane immunogenic protein|uniref:outer membrane protein n=1 Tax=Bradyrhizobium sp. TaxID=376 RepID=UPI003C1EBBBD